MKEINIGRVLIKNRHKRGITQDELATHLGVSKGAVSKWETGSSLPDILLLPQLASYFDISIASGIHVAGGSLSDSYIPL